MRIAPVVASFSESKHVHGVVQLVGAGVRRLGGRHGCKEARRRRRYRRGELVVDGGKAKACGAESVHKGWWALMEGDCEDRMLRKKSLLLRVVRNWPSFLFSGSFWVLLVLWAVFALWSTVVCPARCSATQHRQTALAATFSHGKDVIDGMAIGCLTVFLFDVNASRN